MDRVMSVSKLQHALRDLIRGDGVRRASHDLEIDGKDVSVLFRTLLQSEGYVEIRVEMVDVIPGERVPAFCLMDGKAHFGWVFWEVFSPERKRKIFGSAAKNKKGDWAVVLARRAPVYVCPDRKEAMDVDRPSSF
jgi:hypothetical protein